MLFILAYLAMIIGLYGFESAWIAFLLYHAFIVFVMSRKEDSKYWKQLLKGWEWKSGVALILFGLGGGILLYILAPFAQVNAEMIGPVLERLGLQGFLWLLFVLYHFLVNPWFEEVFWRGKLGSTKKGLVWNDVLFAGYHVLVLVLFLAWYWIVLAFGILILAGWLWRQLATRHKGLLIPVMSHMAADASIMIVVYVLSL